MKNRIKLFLLILILTTTLGASAWLIGSETQQKTNKISVGLIGIKFTNQSKTITIDKGIPQTNLDATINNQSYEFNLTNTEDIDLVYQVVVKIDENSFEDEIINIDTDSLNDNAEISSVQDNTILYTGKLLKKQSVNYSGLIAYINERADKKDLDGKSIKFHLEANAIPLVDTYNKTTNKNIENIGKVINNLQLAMQSGQISFPQTQLDNGNPVVMALVVNSEGLTPYASGCVEINGQDYSTGGGHSRLLHYLENAGLSDIKLETNDNYKFYTIFFFADGSFRIGCGANDDSSEYREDTFENHSKWWKSVPQSMIEKELYS